MTLAGAGRLTEALGVVERQLAETPRDAAALGLKAALLTETGDPGAALILFDRLIKLDPRSSVLHSNRGNALAKLHRPAEAVESFGRAVSLNPRYAVAWSNRAVQQLELGKVEAALADADQAMALNPAMVAAQRARGRALLTLSRFDEALSSIDGALALQPANPDSHILRAEALSALGRPAESLASLERALAANPASVETRCRLALARLRLGDFARGWAESEARWDQPLFRAASTSYPIERLAPVLDKTSRAEDLAGRKVLVINEQGIGDQVMFCSMLPDLLAAGSDVTCFCDVRLLALLADSFPNVRFLPEGGGLDAPLESFDTVIGMGSLGRLFRKSPADCPGAPYLKAPRAESETWRAHLGTKARPLRVGLSWRGGLAHTNRINRSLALDQLTPIISRPDCEFVSVQYGDADAEIAEINRTLANPVTAFPSADYADFVQLAALLQSLDIVVSVQTAVIHLCGALGDPCLVMVPFVAEWRYGVRGDAIPWYRSVRLLRQPSPGAWEPVIEAVGSALDAWPRS
jgi:tetratricopeptide (TPR) repeat protein